MAGKSDPMKRRISGRSGRQKGCYVFLPAAELRKAGVDPEGPLPFYRVWGTPRGGILIRLYRRGSDEQGSAGTALEP